MPAKGRPNKFNKLVDLGATYSCSSLYSENESLTFSAYDNLAFTNVVANPSIIPLP